MCAAFIYTIIHVALSIKCCMFRYVHKFTCNVKIAHAKQHRHIPESTHLSRFAHVRIQ